jgi:hypothetical protein
MIIGLSGYARSGKDEAAKVLVEEFGFTRVAFADKLREVLYALNPIVQADFGFEFRSEWHGPGFIMLQEAIDTYGWDGYKASEFSTEIRRLLQRLGTEAGRQTLWDSIWIDAAFKPYERTGKDIVVTDARFPNEGRAIAERDGYIWRVNRPSVGPAVGKDGSIHPSETSLDNWPFDMVLSNDGTLEEYHDKIRNAYATSTRYRNA